MMRELETLYVDPASDIYINLPNMSLAYAATAHNVPVVDQHMLPYAKDRFLKYRCNTLGISIRSFAAVEAERVAAAYAKRYPEAKVTSIDGFDVQCCYPFMKRGQGIALGIDFSDALPFPRFELFDSFAYMSANWRAGLWNYPLFASLGCPFSCIFCACRNRPYKMRSVDNCITELKQAKEKYGIVSFEILDDVFNLHRERVLEFCAKVAPLGLTWLCSNGLRADRFDEEQAKALAAAGCVSVGFGVESTDPAVLAEIRKGETVAQLEAAIQTAKKYFADVKAYFIVGLPGSNYEKDRASITWAKSMGIKPVTSYYVTEKSKLSDDGVFFGTMARPASTVYPSADQEKVYRFAKEAVRGIYQGQRLPLKLIVKSLKAMTQYDWNALCTHLMIGPKRLLSIIFKGEVQ